MRAVSVKQKVLVATAAGRGLPALPMMVDNSGRLKYNPEMPSGINRILRPKPWLGTISRYENNIILRSDYRLCSLGDSLPF